MGFLKLSKKKIRKIQVIERKLKVIERKLGSGSVFLFFMPLPPKKILQFLINKPFLFLL